MKKIDFSPPLITKEDIKAVVSVLKSGWITTGPKVQEFEDLLMKFTGSASAVCVNSATGGLEVILRAFNFGPDDEIIVTPYTFTATASVVQHVGAKIVFADIEKGSFNISPNEVLKKITKKTKAVIAVDVGGIPCNYMELEEALLSSKHLYNPSHGTMQKSFSKPVLIDDASHSIGASYNGIKIGSVADFTVFSFHAVKNITTAEGGVILTKRNKSLPIGKIDQLFRLYSLHGQNKNAFKREKSGYRYDVLVPAYKFNMTDIQAALGISQMKRWHKINEKRKILYNRYVSNLKNEGKISLTQYDSSKITISYHLMPVRINGFNEIQRDKVISYLKAKDIATNVHFVPLPMFTAYKKMGYNIKDYPNAYNMYKNLITLPIHLKLSLKDVDRVCSGLIEAINAV